VRRWLTRGSIVLLVLLMMAVVVGQATTTASNSSGQTIYMVVHDAPVAASIWQGNWAQMDSIGATIPAGEYMLYVDTSVGTLSRSFKVYDPCCGCWGCWWSCNWCNENSSITTNCYCRTSLVLLKETPDCCWPFFRWSCNPCCP
jgi:hypothetical protein